jgi:hypothetical protein
VGKAQLIVIEPSRDPHVPTPEGRDIVCRAVACGLDELAIAAMLNLDPLALARHYSFELRYGADYYTYKVGSATIDAGMRGDMQAAALFLRARARWTMPTGEESKRAVDKTKLAERKRMMDAIVAHVRPASESSKDKVGAGKDRQSGGGK